MTGEQHGPTAAAAGRRLAAAVLLLAALAAAPARAQDTVIDFDDRSATTCPFSGAERIADQWSALGVTFSAPTSQTGAIQDVAACSWMVSGHSPPNIVAYVAGLADLPLEIDFSPPVELVGLLATNWRGIDTITLTAFDGVGGVVGTSSISSVGMLGVLQPLEVTGAGIVRAEVTNTSFNDDVAFDDVRFRRAATRPCCFADGTCADLAPAACATQGGSDPGTGVDCASATCPQPTRPCCFGDGACADLDPAECATQGGSDPGTGADCASTSCPLPAPPGWTPDGATRPGEPLLVHRAAGGGLELTWGLGCNPDVLDVAVHEGALGDWAGHDAVLCSTGGVRTGATVMPAAGDRYVLAVPVTATEEGSYGLDSFGAERPPTTGTTCAAAQSVACP